MPKRIEVYRVDSTEVQGKDSWVELRCLTWAEVQTSLKTKGENDEELLKTHVLAWNWVDSKGKPLGDPRDSIGKLLLHERWFIIDKLFKPRDKDTIKN